MAGLSKEQLAGKAAYTEANKDIPDAPEWKDLDDEQRQPWIDSAAGNDAGSAEEDKSGSTATAPDASTATTPLESSASDEAPQPVERCLTIRDLAKREFQQAMSGTDEEWEAIPMSEVERWEAIARMKHV